MSQSFKSMNVAAALAALSLTVVARAHTEDFSVGTDAAGAKLVVDYDPALFPWTLPKSVEPALIGFALDDPGFTTEGAEFALGAGADIAMKVLSQSSPEMKAWDPLNPGGDGDQIIGDRLWEIGTPEFDIHPFWHIDKADVNFDPAHEPWDITFKLVDLSGTYGDSDEITVSFVAEPTSALLLLISVGLFARRR